MWCHAWRRTLLQAWHLGSGGVRSWAPVPVAAVTFGVALWQTCQNYALKSDLQKCQVSLKTADHANEKLAEEKDNLTKQNEKLTEQNQKLTEQSAVCKGAEVDGSGYGTRLDEMGKVLQDVRLHSEEIEMRVMELAQVQHSGKGSFGNAAVMTIPCQQGIAPNKVDSDVDKKNEWIVSRGTCKGCLRCDQQDYAALKSEIVKLTTENEKLREQNSFFQKDYNDHKALKGSLRKQLPRSVQADFVNIRWVQVNGHGNMIRLDVPDRLQGELTKAWRKMMKHEQKKGEAPVWDIGGDYMVDFSQPDGPVLNDKRKGTQVHLKFLAFLNPRCRYQEYPLLSGEVFTIPVTPRDYKQGTWHEQHFREAESHFLRMFEQTELIHKNNSAAKTVRVTKVEIVCIESVRKKFWEHATKEFCSRKEKDVLQWGFHGTDDQGMAGIKKDGFKINHSGAGKNGHAFGKGIYLAVRPGLSMRQFMNTTSKQLILAQFINSDQANPHRQGQDGGAVVIKNEEYVYPKYIVHFEEVQF